MSRGAPYAEPSHIPTREVCGRPSGGVGSFPWRRARRTPIAPMGSLTSGREVGLRGEVKERGRPKPKLETASSLG